MSGRKEQAGEVPSELTSEQPPILEYRNPTVAAAPHSRLGMASWFLGCLPFLGMCLAFGLFVTAAAPSGDALRVPLILMIMIAPVLGMALGIAGMFSRGRNRALAIPGIAINVLPCVYVVFLVRWYLAGQ